MKVRMEVRMEVRIIELRFTKAEVLEQVYTPDPLKLFPHFVPS
jgi:hypothetical protein